jgi:4-amino-4-deoxy-L-arabinose transferase-like glycosyltransferase
VRGTEGRRILPGRPVKILAAAIPAVLYLVFLLATLPSVPFHPDEATYIFMSRDWDRIFTLGPLSICWNASGQSDPLQAERERDGPLTRYTIGAARALGGMAATDSNWDWSADWEQNLRRGALPSAALLFLARIPQVLLLFLAVLLMARIGWRVGGGVGAVSAGVLLAVNSQALLHGRRAMSEAGLLFGMILVIAVLLEQKRESSPALRMLLFPLLAGAALALAVSAKYSALLMAPVALAGMFLYADSAMPRRLVLGGLLRTLVLIFGFAAVFLTLDPVFWCNPFGAFSAAVVERGRLLGEQIAALQTAGPRSVLQSPILRVLALPYELFLAPPAVWDIPNYAAQTAAAEQAYLAQPLNTLTAGGILSAVFAVLAGAGLIVSVVRLFRKQADAPSILVLIWTACVLIGILVGVPILWQRYYLPLIPVSAALAAVAVSAMPKVNRQD